MHSPSRGTIRSTFSAHERIRFEAAREPYGLRNKGKDVLRGHRRGAHLVNSIVENERYGIEDLDAGTTNEVWNVVREKGGKTEGTGRLRTFYAPKLIDCCFGNRSPRSRPRGWLVNFVACDLSHRDTVLHNQWVSVTCSMLSYIFVQLRRRTVDVL